MAGWMKVMVLMTAVAALAGCAGSAVSQARTMLVSQTDADQAYARKDCVAAIPLYQELADDLTENAQVLLRLGNCLVREQRREEAMGAYRRALLNDPAFVKAWYNLSYMQAQDLATTVADMSANVDPSDPAAERIRILTANIIEAFKANRVKTVEQKQTNIGQEQGGEMVEE